MADHPFTPHADSIQTAWVLMCQQSRIATQPPVEELEAEFDRFLARVKRDAAREAVPALLDALKQAEARVRHLEDTARVLVKDMLAATDARDEHRRGKAAAEERIAEEKHLRMKATEAATEAEARIEAVEDVLDTWMTYCQTEQTARALSDEEELNLITAINMIREAIGYE